MWFKQSLVFRLPAPWSMDLSTLEEKLSLHPFARCSGSELQSSGWVPPRPGGPMVFALNHQWLIALATEQRLLPASVINDELKERIEAVEEQQGYSPGRK
ncbi:MAG: recombination-associated protein RdgC, partial [Propionivibrio sp.]|nr:recombination-associated protein RdgC [Propionivibrio sp.]